MEGEVGDARASELGTWGLLSPGLNVAWLLIASLASDVTGDRLFCGGVRLATHQLFLGVTGPFSLKREEWLVGWHSLSVSSPSCSSRHHLIQSHLVLIPCRA